MNRIPKRLKKEPLIEAIWQVQFESHNAGEVLPGVLFTKLKKRHRALQLRRLPAADIPSPVAQIDPNLRYITKVLTEEPEGAFLWQVGDRVVTLNCRKPYTGWKAFKEAIESLVDDMKICGLVPQPQRHSLRYLDLLTLKPAPDLSALRLKITLGNHTIGQHNLQMRLEVPTEDCIHVVQVVTPAHANLPEGTQTGTLVDLETIARTEPEDWENVLKQLDTLHTESKEIFFRHILKKETIQKLEPEY